MASGRNCCKRASERMEARVPGREAAATNRGPFRGYSRVRTQSDDPPLLLQ